MLLQNTFSFLILISSCPCILSKAMSSIMHHPPNDQKLHSPMTAFKNKSNSKSNSPMQSNQKFGKILETGSPMSGSSSPCCGSKNYPMKGSHEHILSKRSHAMHSKNSKNPIIKNAPMKGSSHHRSVGAKAMS